MNIDPNQGLIIPRRPFGPLTYKMTSDLGDKVSFLGEPWYSGPFTPPSFGSEPDASRFVKLGPGEAFETTFEMDVAVNFEHIRAPITVQSGSNVSLEFSLMLRPEKATSPEQLSRVRAQWLPFGVLKTGTVNAGPVSFRVPSARGATDWSILTTSQNRVCTEERP